MNKQNQPLLLVTSLAIDPAIVPYMQRLLKHHPEVYRHSINVAFLAAELCCTDIRNDLNLKLDITDKEAVEIIKGALLHDIGKLTIPNKVLNKTEELSKKEIELIMNHPTAGYEMLINDTEHKFSKTVLDIVKHHHEKLDGSGYPDHSKKVSSATQLVALCDMYDALTETRAYRSKKSVYSAYKIIIEEQLDNDLFLLLASCFDR